MENPGLPCGVLIAGKPSMVRLLGDSLPSACFHGAIGVTKKLANEGNFY
jgi:hypothetical protein